MQEERDSVSRREIRLCSIRGSPSDKLGGIPDKEGFRVKEGFRRGEGVPSRMQHGVVITQFFL
jgi:hypothetical protein